MAIMKTGVERPVWAIGVMHCILDQGVELKKVAEDLNVNYKQLSNVLSGYMVDRRVQALVCEYFGDEYTQWSKLSRKLRKARAKNDT